MTKNIGESVRSRLKSIAVKEGSDFNAVLTRYGLERLLYRIGESAYSNQFLLKGALLFNLWYDMPHRPTKDIDLLGFGDNDLAYIKQTFSEICSISADDGMNFLSESVSGQILLKKMVVILEQELGYSVNWQMQRLKYKLILVMVMQ